jgi:hypothetical protein
MRNYLNAFAVVLIALSFAMFQSCKEDTTPPKITIIGSTDTIIAKNSVYVDPGATAEDDKDDEVYVITNFSTTNPDETVPMAYTILYKAQDRNANMATATRTVNVTYTGANLVANYAVTDTAAYIDTLAYSCNITPNALNQFQVYFNGLYNGNLSGQTYADLKANSITIPSQTMDASSGSTRYIISGSGTISEINPNIFIDLIYTVDDTTTGVPTQLRHAVMMY